MNPQEFSQLKKAALQQFFSGMNPEQFEAITTVQHPVLVLAGAGSGKTTVIVNRIAHMILFGDTLHVPTEIPDADALQKLEDYIHGRISLTIGELQNLIAVQPVNPWQILAITFTNKAAGELKERLSGTLGDVAQDIHAATFHSACVRILRTCIDRIGYTTNFTIYDSDDSLKTIKTCMKKFNISEKNFPAKQVLSAISTAKDQMLSPEDYQSQAEQDYKLTVYAKLYQEYQKNLQDANALDFDDLIYQTVRVFETQPDILEKYQNKYRYILVDEYQDTNHAQYRFISLLSKKYQNLCVVGDDDQSIYRFRGATIENILSFEDQFPNCKTIRLEENYRSTQHILSAANSVIAHNKNRKAKTLRTSAGDGEKIQLIEHYHKNEQAKEIANIIKNEIKKGKKYSDFAILYRMNFLSKNIEQALIRNNIPYKIYGGLRFQDRKEIKDILSYLCVLQNPNDLVRFQRILSLQDGIGASTIEKILKISEDLKISPLEVIRNCKNFPALSRKSNLLLKFSKNIDLLMEKMNDLSMIDFFDSVITITNYYSTLEKESETEDERKDNIAELKKSIIEYTTTAKAPTLEEFLEEMTLYSDIENDENTETVSLMTVHSAKGLEFDTVFCIGLEEGIFPNGKAIKSAQLGDLSDLEEERRLAYVMITRAKRHLYLMHSSIEINNWNDYEEYETTISRFIQEIPSKHIESPDFSTKQDLINVNSKNFSGGLNQQISMFSQTKKNPPSKGNLDLKFSIGDRIQDSKFGEGTVLRADFMGNDYLLEIAFDTVGTKKLMARYRQIIKL